MNEMELLTKMLATIPEDASPTRAQARVCAAIGPDRHHEVPSRQATARSWQAVSRPARTTRATGAPARSRARRQVRLVLAGVVAAAALAGALVTLGLLPGGTSAGGLRPGGSDAQLAAWTVQRVPGGLLIVTIRDLRDPNGLAALLRKYSVPARLEFPGYDFTPTTSLSVLPRGCKSPNLSNRAYAKLEMKIDPPPPVWMHLHLHYVKGPHGLVGYGEFRRPPGGLAARGVFAIRPSAIPAGIGLFIEAWTNPHAIPPGGSGGLLSMNSDLVDASRPCTGG
jgi:hypothetical protein